MKSREVLCVIVTYNRLHCLKECLDAVFAQTFTDFDVLVINNGSTDGTAEFLQTLTSKCIIINQDNVGGAGGFCRGMKYMLENEYSYLWMMDDDGIPDPLQLEKLYSHSSISWYLNAFVLNKDCHDEFAFPLNKGDGIEKYKDLDVTSDFVHPFNGTFLNRKLLDKIGVIKKEMFIWGDEKEYTFRAIKFGEVTPTTVISAVHYHPKEKGIKENALPFGWFSNNKILVKPEKLSKYYYRNLGYIDATYNSNLKSLKWFVLNLVYFIRKIKFKELDKFVKYYLKGRKNIYN